MYLCPRALSAFGTALQEIQCSPLQLQKPKDLHLSRTVCSVFFWNTDIGDICGPSNFHFWGLYLGCISSHAVLIPKVLTFVIMFPSTTGPSTISPISVLPTSLFQLPFEMKFLVIEQTLKCLSFWFLFKFPPFIRPFPSCLFV